LLVVGRGYIAGNGGGLFGSRFSRGSGLVVIHAFFEGGDTFANFAHQGRNFALAKQDKNNDGDQKKTKGSGSVHEKSSITPHGAAVLTKSKGQSVATCKAQFG